jgi:hypothetical protein
MTCAMYVFCGILKFVVASAAEAELKILRLVLQELGHHQPPTPIHCDNATAAGIANDTVKKQRSVQWKCIFSGSQIKLNAICLMLDGISRTREFS